MQGGGVCLSAQLPCEKTRRRRRELPFPTHYTQQSQQIENYRVSTRQRQPLSTFQHLRSRVLSEMSGFTVISKPSSIHPGSGWTLVYQVPYFFFSLITFFPKRDKKTKKCLRIGIESGAGDTKQETMKITLEAYLTAGGWSVFDQHFHHHLPVRFGAL